MGMLATTSSPHYVAAGERDKGFSGIQTGFSTLGILRNWDARCSNYVTFHRHAKSFFGCRSTCA